MRAAQKLLGDNQPTVYRTIVAASSVPTWNSRSRASKGKVLLGYYEQLVQAKNGCTVTVRLGRGRVRTLQIMPRRDCNVLGLGHGGSVYTERRLRVGPRCGQGGNPCCYPWQCASSINAAVTCAAYVHTHAFAFHAATCCWMAAAFLPPRPRRPAPRERFLFFGSSL